MPKIAYMKKSLSPDRLALIEQANTIIAEYAEQGFELTLRQLYYQFVSRDLFPASWADPDTGSTNNTRSYNKLGDVVSDGRMLGLIDWNAIADRLRELNRLPHWDSPRDIVSACALQFRVDLWKEQEHHVEVWVEKDALSGVVAQAANACDVAYLVCRGYASQTALWEAGQRLLAAHRAGKKPVVLHLGDHDPSGIDMTRDNRERLEMFAQCGVTVERIALNMDQVRRYNPPPNPAKETDSRFAGYQAEHGDESWELDALEPPVLVKLIQKAIRKFEDAGALRRAKDAQDDYRNQLTTVARRWNRCVELIEAEPETDEEE